MQNLGNGGGVRLPPIFLSCEKSSEKKVLTRVHLRVYDEYIKTSLNSKRKRAGADSIRRTQANERKPTETNGKTTNTKPTGTKYKEDKTMMRTYNATTFMDNERLQQATIRIFVYKEDKYTEKITDETEIKYTGLTAWDIIEGGEEAEAIEADGLVDEHHEYLVLHFNDGTTATYRNSHVDMFLR